MTRDSLQKHVMLPILASTVCPICQHVKQAYTWVCGHCGRPHLETPEHRALSDACDAHLDAARTFLVLLNRLAQKPETD